jgi:hypothetical protein
LRQDRNELIVRRRRDPATAEGCVCPDSQSRPC